MSLELPRFRSYQYLYNVATRFHCAKIHDNRCLCIKVLMAAVVSTITFPLLIRANETVTKISATEVASIYSAFWLASAFGHGAWFNASFYLLATLSLISFYKDSQAFNFAHFSYASFYYNELKMYKSFVRKCFLSMLKMREAWSFSKLDAVFPNIFVQTHRMLLESQASLRSKLLYLQTFATLFDELYLLAF